MAVPDTPELASAGSAREAQSRLDGSDVSAAAWIAGRCCDDGRTWQNEKPPVPTGGNHSQAVITPSTLDVSNGLRLRARRDRRSWSCSQSSSRG